MEVWKQPLYLHYQSNYAEVKTKKMKIQIEKQIEVNTDGNFAGLNAIIRHALKAKSISEFDQECNADYEIQEQDFFIYNGGSHVAIHEILPNGERSERLLFIHN